MVEVRLASVGKLKQPFCRDGAAFYVQRLRHYAKMELREVKGGAGEVSELSRALEGCRSVMVLDRRGREVDSEGLSRWLSQAMQQGRVPIGFAIGGADGIPDGFLAPLADRVRFSRLTFPHELFRVVFLEQLYRALTILAGEPYHLGH